MMKTVIFFYSIYSDLRTLATLNSESSQQSCKRYHWPHFRDEEAEALSVLWLVLSQAAGKGQSTGSRITCLWFQSLGSSHSVKVLLKISEQGI